MAINETGGNMKKESGANGWWVVPLFPAVPSTDEVRVVREMEMLIGACPNHGFWPTTNHDLKREFAYV